VDDWAWRNGQRYGTILVDLERRGVLDLLPDREPATLATWLRLHPEIEIISRDRAGAYAEGALAGAPGAVQVADRFHLLRNLTNAVQRAVERHRRVLRATVPPMERPASTARAPGPTRTPLARRSERRKAATRERRHARYD
jgi:transposase